MNKFQVTGDYTLIYNLNQGKLDCAISLAHIKQDKLRENIGDVILEALNNSYLVDED